ncbi:MAG: C4-dicarboxylate ABC transporter substrate-binding protein, partial [Pseudomonadota bacterium]
MTNVRPKKSGILAVAAASVAAMTMFGAHGASAQTYTMKIGTPTINDTQHEWMKRFKAKIEKKTGGKLQVKLFPSSQLGPIPRMIEGMQLGTIEAVTAPALFFVGVDRRNSAMYVPGMYPSLENCS